MDGQPRRSKAGRPSRHSGLFQEFKDVLIGMYRKQKKTIPEIRELMNQRHGFHPTERQYLYHFERWGVKKNVRSEEMKRLARQKLSSRGGYRPVTYTQGENDVDEEKVERWMKRQPPDVIEDLQRSVEAAERARFERHAVNHGVTQQNSGVEDSIEQEPDPDSMDSEAPGVANTETNITLEETSPARIDSVDEVSGALSPDNAETLPSEVDAAITRLDESFQQVDSEEPTAAEEPSGSVGATPLKEEIFPVSLYGHFRGVVRGQHCITFGTHCLCNFVAPWDRDRLKRELQSVLMGEQMSSSSDVLTLLTQNRRLKDEALPVCSNALSHGNQHVAEVFFACGVSRHMVLRYAIFHYDERLINLLLRQIICLNGWKRDVTSRADALPRHDAWGYQLPQSPLLVASMMKDLNCMEELILKGADFLDAIANSCLYPDNVRIEMIESLSRVPGGQLVVDLFLQNILRIAPTTDPLSAFAPLFDDFNTWISVATDLSPESHDIHYALLEQLRRRRLEKSWALGPLPTAPSDYFFSDVLDIQFVEHVQAAKVLLPNLSQVQQVAPWSSVCSDPSCSVFAHPHYLRNQLGEGHSRSWMFSSNTVENQKPSFSEVELALLSRRTRSDQGIWAVRLRFINIHQNLYWSSFNKIHSRGLIDKGHRVAWRRAILMLRAVCHGRRHEVNILNIFPFLCLSRAVAESVPQEREACINDFHQDANHWGDIFECSHARQAYELTYSELLSFDPFFASGHNRHKASEAWASLREAVAQVVLDSMLLDPDHPSDTAHDNEPSPPTGQLPEDETRRPGRRAEGFDEIPPDPGPRTEKQPPDRLLCPKMTELRGRAQCDSRLTAGVLLIATSFVFALLIHFLQFGCSGVLWASDDNQTPSTSGIPRYSPAASVGINLFEKVEPWVGPMMPQMSRESTPMQEWTPSWG